ncbi:MAG: glycosyltransferase family 9 protein [Nitrospinae bacterium]|nr:glycosyltransferase family 9 protein [Nitrospinota bacterium]MBL7019268.1 glycosyltransferase family 9 protein [Nitrospinaceae bacterium]
MKLLRALGFPHKAKKPNSIYIGLIAGVGDLVLAAPSIVAIKKKFPKAYLCFGVGGGVFHDIIANDPNIDEFDTPIFYYPSTKNVWKILVREKLFFIKSLAYDLVIFLDGPNKKGLDRGQHLIDLYSEKCEVTLERRRPIVYLNAEDSAQGEDILAQVGIEKGEPFIVLSPETRFAKAAKEWPRKNFLELVRRVHEKYSVKFITFVSPASNKDYPGTITVKNAPTIRAVASVIGRAFLFIGCDNGLTHIASSFDSKMISIHLGHPKERSQPISPNATVIFSCLYRDPESVTVDQVYEEVEKALVTLTPKSEKLLE